MKQYTYDFEVETMLTMFMNAMSDIVIKRFRNRQTRDNLKVRIVYAPTADDPEQLRDSIQSAIQSVSGETALKASGKWAAKFLADRLMTLLKDKVKYTTSAEGEEVQKDMTQKEFKQALNKALEEAPAEAPSEDSAEDSEEEETSTDTDKQVETVYTKAADLQTDDSDLQKAFSKLPEDKDMSWEEVLKTVGMTKGLALIDAGGLIETEKEIEPNEDDEVKDLEFDDEGENEGRGYESDFEQALRDIGGARTTRDFNPSWD